MTAAHFPLLFVTSEVWWRRRGKKEKRMEKTSLLERVRDFCCALFASVKSILSVLCLGPHPPHLSLSLPLALPPSLSLSLLSSFFSSLRFPFHLSNRSCRELLLLLWLMVSSSAAFPHVCAPNGTPLPSLCRSAECQHSEFTSMTQEKYEFTSMTQEKYEFTRMTQEKYELLIFFFVRSITETD